MKAFMVSETSLAELSEAIDLGRFIRLNRGEEKTGGRRKRALLADAYEAVIGAMYLDGGIEAAQRFLRRELSAKMASIDPDSMIGDDYKSALQESLQAQGRPMPEYILIEASGPDHRRTFRVQLRVAGVILGWGEGSTIKLAQQEAARSALTFDSPLVPELEPDRVVPDFLDSEPLKQACGHDEPAGQDGDGESALASTRPD
jgi:ribonuclease-3